MYTGYEIRVYDDDDIYALISQHYPDALAKVKQITVGAVLADIFRYIILYLEGGIYADMDCEPLRPIEGLFTEPYFHGDPARDHHFYLYPDAAPLASRVWDFHENPCDNSEAIATDHPWIKTVKCKGHAVGDPDAILCYEFHRVWHPAGPPEQICQWFMIAKPGQALFKRMAEDCLAKLDTLIALRPGPAYEHTILNTTGPAAFTRVVKSVGGNVLVLPSDFFCAGSWGGAVPQTANSVIQHHFTGSWK